MSELIDGRYRLIEIIASGGMATVWRARDTRLDREVALKRPHPGFGDDRWRERLEREARLAAGISHPNLVTIFDASSDDEGPYLVMELVDAPTLADDIDPLSTSQVTTMGAQLASALAAVHAAGIVHRDVKPANILLGSDGPLLTDFGIARRPDASDQLTTEGAVITTPSYAAPEVLQGASPTPAGDVFSLGAVLYELLSGSPAFRGADRTPPSPLADPALDALIRSTLDPEPSRRPPASELANALQSGAPTVRVAPGPRTTARLTPEPDNGSAANAPQEERRRRGLLVLLATAILAVLGTLAVMALQDPAPSTATTEVTPAPAPSTTSTLAPTTTTLAPTTATLATTTTTEPATTTTVPPTTTSIPDEATDQALAEVGELRNLVAGLGPPELKPKDERQISESLDVIEQIISSGYQGGEDDPDRRQLDNALDDIMNGAQQIRDNDMADEVLAALDDLRAAIDALRQ